MNGIITGKEIMDRWGITAFQLQDVLREGELVAVQDDLIVRRTPESDSCLFCDGQRELEPGISFPAVCVGAVVLCEHAPERDVQHLTQSLGRPQLPYEVYLERRADFPSAPDMVAKRRCAHRWTEYHRCHRIEAAKFLLFELEAYEKTNGMWHPGEERPSAPKQRISQAKEDERQQSLLLLALGYVRERGKRVTNDELLKFLCRNSQEEVSVRAMKEVWNKLPPESRKGAGRPKKEA